jgi:ATP-dependent helicase HrpB
LPIDAFVGPVRTTFEDGANLVLIAPPGAGKSTRLPLALLDDAWMDGGKIMLVVPRRLAALGAARRMADERGEDVGQVIGHRVRFDTKVSAATRLEVMTAGVFTRMIAQDPELGDVRLVLFDEVHERALAADFGMALALEAQGALRPDLRIAAMSATVDGQAFETVLGQHLPVKTIASDGAMFPVATHHEPVSGVTPQTVAQAAHQALDRFDGDGLIFLPGQREIEDAATRLRQALGRSVAIHLLYGAVSRKAQAAALAPDPDGRRKLIVASAIAETSLTIPGVCFVIDSGLARRPIYDPARGITRLETKAASRASIDQRRGRAGRTAPGDCVRLWRKEEEGGRPAQDRPEILDADLASLRLEMAVWGSLERQSLPFLDVPPQRAWDEAGRLLQSLGAIDGAGLATALGKKMARRPAHPRLAAMLESALESEKSDAAWAAILAGELPERGPLDAGERLQQALAIPHQAKPLKAVQSRFLGAAKPGPPPDSATLARHLLTAYPDRVAKYQKDDGARATYKLAQGMQAVVDAHQHLVRHALLIVLDVGGGRKTSPQTGPKARPMAGAVRVPDIRLALPVDESAVRDALGHLIRTVEAVQFDKDKWSEQVRQQSKLGEVVLSETAQPRRTGLEALSSVINHLQKRGLDALPLADKKAKAVLSRHLAFHAARGAPETLLDRLDQWLPTLLEAAPQPPFSAETLQNALRTALQWDEAQAFDQQWPNAVLLRGEQRARMLYDHPAGPAISVRPRDLYGLDTHPTFGPDKQPVLIELLSPAQRPIALTGDLPAFWRAGWRDVRKDMRARYPKHDWPEEPWKGPTRRKS